MLILSLSCPPHYLSPCRFSFSVESKTICKVEPAKSKKRRAKASVLFIVLLFLFLYTQKFLIDLRLPLFVLSLDIILINPILKIQTNF